MSGFFPEGSFSKAKSFSVASRCGACGLYKKCNSPKMEPQGHGKIMFVLPPVTKQEDASGKFLRSALGQVLRRLLLDNGLNPMEECVFTSALICHTGYAKGEQVDNCSYKLKEAIEEHQPIVVIPIGPMAVRSIIQFTWKRAAGVTKRWFDQQIPSQEIDAWICPVYEPDMEEKEYKKDNLMPFFIRGVEAAIRKKKRPWPKPPEFEKRIKQLTATEAAHLLSSFINEEFFAAFDYETSCLKPDNPQSARIVSGAFCPSMGVSYAFPWSKDLPPILKQLARSKKAHWIGSNNKYEERWTTRLLGFRFRNWIWDTMLSAHAIDSKGGRDEENDSSRGGGLSSLKVQAYTLIGQPVYDDHIKDFLDADGSYKRNRIHEVPMSDVLQYNGMDALMTRLVAKRQMKLIGSELGDLL